MLYIRILQYFFIGSNNLEVKYKDMKNNLKNFFDEEEIYNATRRLVYVRFIYSYIQGDNIIATISDWEEIEMDDITVLKLSSVGKFYMEKMIYEFEYLYQMAFSSLMCEQYVDELQKCWKTEKEKTVLYFLKSIYEIINESINTYSSEKLIPFKNLFYYIDDQNGSRPFRKMLNRFISVMNNKVQRAEKLDTSKMPKLEKILIEVLELKKEVNNYFTERLG